MDNETLQAIGRLRRSQGRNADTMLVCDTLENLSRALTITAKAATPPEPVIQPRLLATGDCPECARRREQTRLRVQKVRAKK